MEQPGRSERGRGIKLLGLAGGALLWIVVALCLAVTIVPAFLDRIYYRGPVSGHFDGERFFNPDGEDTVAPVRGGRAQLIWRQFVHDPDRPWWPEKLAVASSKPPVRVEGKRMLVTWIGHATLLVQADGLNILTDPIWSERAGPFGFGPGRVAEPGVRFEDLPKIDLVAISHNHYDHLDLATLKRLWERDRPLIVTSLGNDSVLDQAGIPGRALDWGEGLYRHRGGWVRRVPDPRCAERPPVCGISGVRAMRNHHWDSRWFADRNRALWSAFLFELPHGNAYFAGDTGLGDGKWPAEALARGPIRFAGLPIGAFRFEEGQMRSGSHIGPGEAIEVWNGLGRPFALPIHWGTFRLSREGYATPPRLLAAMMGCAGSDVRRFLPVAIGRPVEVPPLAAQAPVPVPDLAAVERCRRAGMFDLYR